MDNDTGYASIVSMITFLIENRNGILPIAPSSIRENDRRETNITKKELVHISQYWNS